ncbi:hypothetical protein EC973_000222 [Apophysomyces ossiformis]|uniref:Uncharacterized protein n=1 Tax=Apophysomyces ossiformis TaxID=679940 RepID=A0A8H7BV69_9FUNG|nr:hypothetical protein EC973_000222 [Apophysomyces ossiformis]
MVRASGTTNLTNREIDILLDVLRQLKPWSTRGGWQTATKRFNSISKSRNPTAPFRPEATLRSRFRGLLLADVARAAKQIWESDHINPTSRRTRRSKRAPVVIPSEPRNSLRGSSPSSTTTPTSSCILPDQHNSSTATIATGEVSTHHSESVPQLSQQATQQTSTQSSRPAAAQSSQPVQSVQSLRAIQPLQSSSQPQNSPDSNVMFRRLVNASNNAGSPDNSMTRILDMLETVLKETLQKESTTVMVHSVFLPI